MMPIKGLTCSTCGGRIHLGEYHLCPGIPHTQTFNSSLTQMQREVKLKQEAEELKAQIQAMKKQDPKNYKLLWEQLRRIMDRRLERSILQAQREDFDSILKIMDDLEGGN